jgi:general secretion pathway protein D
VVLGGIISNNDNRNVQKIPILGDIPLLGHLFRNTTRNRGRTELVVFLTPHVVREDEDADEILQYERHRLQVDPIKGLDAPFVRPLEITPQDLKRIREGKRQGGQATP